jgi:hypothetical protein
MSHSRTKDARDDAEQVITAELPLKISAAVTRIGSTLGVRLLKPNDEVAIAAQEYYVAKEIFKAAETRSKSARSDLVNLLKIPKAKGKHIVHDSATATVLADQRSAPSRLNENALVNLLCKEFSCDVTEAQRLISECRSGSDEYVTHITVVLK